MLEVSKIATEEPINPTILEKNDQLERSGLEKIGNALALIHEGIRMEDAMKHLIFGDEVPAEAVGKFDFIALDTDEIAPDPNDEADILRQYEIERRKNEAFQAQYAKEAYNRLNLWYKILNRLTGSPTNWGSRITLTEDQRKEGYLDIWKTWRKWNLKTGFMSHFLDPSKQARDFENFVEGVMKVDSAEYRRFLAEIKSKPDKPFLIIQGHGGDREDRPQNWQIGEKSTTNYTDLTKIFDRMDIQSGKYSAILLFSCNEPKATPLKSGDTPLFYVEGIAGPYTEERRTKVI